MKYRLYGKYGVTDREYQKLADWGVIKAKNLNSFGMPVSRAVKVKKRKIVKEKRLDGHVSETERSVSGSNASDYTFKSIIEYKDNDIGDPAEANEGYVVGPLDKTIYGVKKANESLKMWRQRKLENAKSSTKGSEWNRR